MGAQQNGIPSYNRAVLQQDVAASAALVDISGWSFVLPANKIINLYAEIPFIVAATGGFKWQLTSTQTLVDYLAMWEVSDGVTASPGAQIVSVLTAQAAFANAFASVAGNHKCELFASVKGHATLDSTVSVQFACNSAAGQISIIKGATLTQIRL